MLIYFVNAILRSTYVINFSIDAIVGSVALVLFVRNEWLKYRISKACLNKKDYIIYDLLTLIFCILLKFFIYHFDISLIIFIASYYFTKRRWTQDLNDIFDEDWLKISLHFFIKKRLILIYTYGIINPHCDEVRGCWPTEKRCHG